MPLFKFLRHGDLKENFESTGRRDLNIKYTNFDYLKYWECHAYEYSYYECVQCNYICENGEHILTGEQKLISTTGEEKTVCYLYWGNDLHTKAGIPSITCIEIMTNIRKEIPSTYERALTNIRKEIPSTYERAYLYWDNNQHTRGNTVSYLNGATTNIRKEIPSITSMGQRPAYERKYRQLPQWGNDQHTKENTVNYLYGVTTNIRKEIPSITSMG